MCSMSVHYIIQNAILHIILYTYTYIHIILYTLYYVILLVFKVNCKYITEIITVVRFCHYISVQNLLLICLH
jgi:hypothetical protein